MRILFLTPYVPSFRAGGEKFTKLLIEDLSKENQVDLIYYKYSFDKLYQAPNANVRVLKVCHNSTIIKLWNSIKKPFLHPTFTIRFHKKLLKFVKDQLDQQHYDLLYLDHSQMLLYGSFFPDIPKILMSHDVMAERFGHKKGLISFFVKYTEKKLMRIPNLEIFTFSDKDVQLIKDTYGFKSYSTNFYLDQHIIDAKANDIENRFVFLGKWKRPDNFDGLKWFFEKVYPLRPKTERYSIIGIGMPNSFKEFIKDLPNVEYHGFVDNPYKTIANSKAVISPIFSGAGVKVKVVEALACGTPVIGSTLAFEGISKDFSKFMLLADSAEDYSNAIDSLQLSSEERELFKTKFLNSYQAKSIPFYLKNK